MSKLSHYRFYAIEAKLHIFKLAMSGQRRFKSASASLIASLRSKTNQILDI
jgi:hypothetical protein